jgi:hypothetical protein
MSFLKFKINAEDSLHLNVTNIARVRTNSNANSMTVEYSYVGAGGASNRTLPIQFATAITDAQIASVEALAFKVNKAAGSIADTESILGGNYLQTFSRPK